MHQLTHRTFAHRVLLHQVLELTDQFARKAALQIGLDSSLQRLDLQLLEPGDLCSREVVVREVLERVTVPERECLAEDLGSGVGFDRHSRSRLVYGRFEAPGVNGPGINAYQIAVIASHQHSALATFRTVRFECGTQT
ncbi:MAG: hypothetical protein QOJ08_1714 [Ilumatobacteraceae bacterium]